MNLFNRLIFTILSIFLLVNISHSQPVMGFQGGLNLAGFLGHKDYDENKPRFGVTAYVFTDIPLGRNSIVSIETGLAFSPQGSNNVKIYDSLTFTNTKKIHNKVNYLILPVYLKENYTNFYTKIGPYVGYLLSAESKWTNDQTQGTVFLKQTSGTNTKFTENINQIDYGLSFGFGFIHFFDPTAFRNRRHRNRNTPVLQVDFKYNLGLKSIDASGQNSEMNLKNHVFTVGLSITSVRN